MKRVTYDLFTYADTLDLESISHSNEFECLSALRRNEAGYAGDRQAEAKVRQIYEAGRDLRRRLDVQEITHMRYQDEIVKVMTELWCVTVRGEVSRNLFDQPLLPKEYSPRFETNIRGKVPKELPIPDEVLIAFYQYRPSEMQPRHFVSFVQDKKWFTGVVMYDGIKGKWTEPRITRDYGNEYRADEPHQWFTKGGFRALQEARKLNDLIPAVSTARYKFYGRDEAIRLLRRRGLLNAVEEARGAICLG